MTSRFERDFLFPKPKTSPLERRGCRKMKPRRHKRNLIYQDPSEGKAAGFRSETTDESIALNRIYYEGIRHNVSGTRTMDRKPDFTTLRYASDKLSADRYETDKEHLRESFTLRTGSIE